MFFRREDHLDDWVKEQFNQLGLVNQRDYYTQSTMPDYLKEALKGRSKTDKKTRSGEPDFRSCLHSAGFVV